MSPGFIVISLIIPKLSMMRNIQSFSTSCSIFMIVPITRLSGLSTCVSTVEPRKYLRGPKFETRCNFVAVYFSSIGFIVSPINVDTLLNIAATKAFFLATQLFKTELQWKKLIKKINIAGWWRYLIGYQMLGDSLVFSSVIQCYKFPKSLYFWQIFFRSPWTWVS